MTEIDADAAAAADRDARADISNGLSALMKQRYGKGPTKARTYLNDEYVFCALEGVLTRNEETLLEAGEDELVRMYRLRFQAAVADEARAVVERATGREVLDYHSQIVFHPQRAFEIFILAPPGGG